MKNGVYYREDLNRTAHAGCSKCGENHQSILYLASKCHPKEAIEVAYDSLAGTIEFRCGKCNKKLVSRVKVASEINEEQ